MPINQSSYILFIQSLLKRTEIEHVTELNTLIAKETVPNQNKCSNLIWLIKFVITMQWLSDTLLQPMPS